MVFFETPGSLRNLRLVEDSAVPYPLTLLKEDCRISIFNALSRRAIVSRVILLFPLSKVETYCWEQPIRWANCTCVIDCSSIDSSTLKAIIREYFSQKALSLRH